MISPKVYDLCTATETVSSLVAKDPELSPGDAYKKLYGGHSTGPKESVAKAREHREVHTADDLKRARDCGKWGPTEPYPPLMGSCGTIPLSVISVYVHRLRFGPIRSRVACRVPDIMRHMSNLIVRADKEVILATNYWQNSVASKYITNAMKELSRRAGERGTRIVMKLEYDRGSPRQLIEPHYSVSQKEYTGKNVGIPPPDEIPNIDLQVENYHRPMLGTFHCKYMIVDRKYAVLQSNNIQDNDNVEMMTHLEGPIVDSLYDMALISWSKKLTPTLPSADHPEVEGGLGEELAGEDGGENRADVLTGPTTVESVVHPVGQSSSQANEAVSDNKSTDQLNYQGQVKGPDEATKVFLYSGKQGVSVAQIAHPSPDGALLPEHTTDDPHYDTDIAGEIARVQTSVSPKPGETRMEAITKHLNHTKNVGFPGPAPPRGTGEEMTPYMAHPTAEPFPIAMVCREPYGTPNHDSVYNPQNEAWLSALRNATKNVFIQSPTLNAAPLVPAIIAACERGIDVFCYICLGYNDTGELLPGQGGTNEMIVHKMYTTLSDKGKQHLHYYWYIGADQTVPIVAKKKKRSCHVKVMIVDEHIGIQGNGNQDTQSWYHSQEINVMFDSATVCKGWIDGLRRNQNTHLYGPVDKTDGIWRDQDGNQPQDVIGVDPGNFSWAKGFVGAIERVRGTGDF
ncbi:iq calmodulin-binding motif protein [Mycena filopes]|nr:iq calmodulin-binding motif protein [Mycena filopes]